MEVSIRNLLDSHDSLEAVECPPGFDWEGTQARIGALKPVMERISGREVEHDDGVQDATFCADLSIHKLSQEGRSIETIFALRFSNFGELFTTWRVCPSEALPEEVAKEIIDAAVEAGFRFVPPQDLEEPYDGRCPGFLGNSWWYRFFDYT